MTFVHIFFLCFIYHFYFPHHFFFPLWLYSVIGLLLLCVFIDKHFCNFSVFHIFLFLFSLFILWCFYVWILLYSTFLWIYAVFSLTICFFFSLNYSLHHLILSYFQFNKFISLESLFLISQASFILYSLPTIFLYFSHSLVFFL